MGAQAIVFVEFDNRHTRCALKRWGFQPLAPHTLDHGKIKDRPALVEGLRALVEQYRLQGASVAMAVSGASVIVKRIHVPRRHQQNLDEYLMWEGAQYLPYDPDEVYLDFSVCASPSPGVMSDEMPLVLVAAKREAVDERRELLEEVNLHPTICDVETLAILNLAIRNEEVQAHHSYLMVNIQDAMMNVAVVENGDPLLVRDVSFTSEQQPIFAMGEFHDIGRLASSNDVFRDHDMKPSYFEPMNGHEIVNELKRTVEGAREFQPDLHLERIFLSGPLSLSLELQEEISRSLMAGVSAINLFAPFDTDDRDAVGPPIHSGANVAGGLALRIHQG